MWTYRQQTGDLINNRGEIVGSGYSGHGDGRNNPDMETSKSHGPIPRNYYRILEPGNTKRHGPYVMTLDPKPGSNMHGRSGFLIHGNNLTNDASLGCIILDRATRDLIWQSGDHMLRVIT